MSFSNELSISVPSFPHLYLYYPYLFRVLPQPRLCCLLRPRREPYPTYFTTSSSGSGSSFSTSFKLCSSTYPQESVAAQQNPVHIFSLSSNEKIAFKFSRNTDSLCYYVSVGVRRAPRSRLSVRCQQASAHTSGHGKADRACRF